MTALAPPILRPGRLLAARWEGETPTAPQWQVDRADAMLHALERLTDALDIPLALSTRIGQLVAARARLDDPDGCQCAEPCCSRRTEPGGSLLDCEPCQERLATEAQEAGEALFAWAADLTGLMQALLVEHLLVEYAPGPSWPLVVGERVLAVVW